MPTAPADTRQDMIGAVGGRTARRNGSISMLSFTAVEAGSELLPWRERITSLINI